MALLFVLACGADVLAAVPKPDTTFVPAHPRNYRREGPGRPIDRIVLHTIEGSSGAGVNTFNSYDPSRGGVSAHYIVGKDGRIIQMVRDEDVAFHVRGLNSRSIGIEFEGHAQRDGWTEAQMRAGADLVRYLSGRYGVPLDRRHVQAHGELDPARRSDPGPYFDWSYFLAISKGDPAKGVDRVDVVTGLAKGLGLRPLRPETPSFQDVPADHPAYGWIEAAKAAGLVAGDGRGRFRPERALTREALVQLVRAAARHRGQDPDEAVRALLDGWGGTVGDGGRLASPADLDRALSRPEVDHRGVLGALDDLGG